MPSDEEIVALIKRFSRCLPRNVMTKMDQTNIGIGMVLRYLSEVGRPVSAGEISRYMKVSTARVAVLLRTMTEKGLIVKSEDLTDARKVRISLSERGRESNRLATEELRQLMRKIVREVGSERVELFLAISGEINAVVAETIAEKKV